MNDYFKKFSLISFIYLFIYLSIYFILLIYLFYFIFFIFLIWFQHWPPELLSCKSNPILYKPRHIQAKWESWNCGYVIETQHSTCCLFTVLNWHSVRNVLLPTHNFVSLRNFLTLGIIFLFSENLIHGFERYWSFKCPQAR